MRGGVFNDTIIGVRTIIPTIGIVMIYQILVILYEIFLLTGKVQIIERRAAITVNRGWYVIHQKDPIPYFATFVTDITEPSL